MVGRTDPSRQVLEREVQNAVRAVDPRMVFLAFEPMGSVINSRPRYPSPRRQSPDRLRAARHRPLGDRSLWADGVFDGAAGTRSRHPDGGWGDRRRWSFGVSCPKACSSRPLRHRARPDWRGLHFSCAGRPSVWCHTAGLYRHSPASSCCCSSSPHWPLRCPRQRAAPHRSRPGASV